MKRTPQCSAIPTGNGQPGYEPFRPAARMSRPDDRRPRRQSPRDPNRPAARPKKDAPSTKPKDCLRTTRKTRKTPFAACLRCSSEQRIQPRLNPAETLRPENSCPHLRVDSRFKQMLRGIGHPLTKQCCWWARARTLQARTAGIKRSVRQTGNFAKACRKPYPRATSKQIPFQAVAAPWNLLEQAVAFDG